MADLYARVAPGSANDPWARSLSERNGLGAPTGLTATALSSTSVLVEWADASSGETGFNVYRAPDVSGSPGTFALVGTAAAEDEAYADTSVLPGLTYHYRATSFSGIAESDPSNTDTATTDVDVPSQVLGLVAVPFSASRIDLSWDLPESDGGTAITGYKIERESPVGGGWATLVADTGTTTRTYENSGLSEVVQYNYRVSAINAEGTGPASDPDEATTLSASPGGSVTVEASHLAVTVPVGSSTDLTNRWWFTSVNTYDFTKARTTFEIDNILEDFNFSSMMKIIIGTSRGVGYRVEFTFWVDSDGLPKVIIDIRFGLSSAVTLDLDWSTSKYWRIDNEGPYTWSVWSSEDKENWAFRLRGDAELPVSGAERVIIECFRDNTTLEDSTTTVFKLGGLNCPAAGEPLPEGRILNGLLDYFISGSGKEFDVDDWEGPGIAIVNTDQLGLTAAVEDTFYAVRLANVPLLTGCYVTMEYFNGAIFASDNGVGLCGNVTPGEVDFQGANAHNTGVFASSGYGGSVSIVDNVASALGSGISSKARNNWHFIHGWVEPSVNPPNSEARIQSTTPPSEQTFTQSAMPGQITGKPGIYGVYNADNDGIYVRKYFAVRDRFVRVKGLQPGRKANVRTSGGAKRFTDAVANSLGVALVDVFGDQTPTSSYDVVVLEPDGSTVVRSYHPAGDGIVWGGDIYNLP